jgi:hypothetical protein
MGALPVLEGKLRSSQEALLALAGVSDQLAAALKGAERRPRRPPTAGLLRLRVSTAPSPPGFDRRRKLGRRLDPPSSRPKKLTVVSGGIAATPGRAPPASASFQRSTPSIDQEAPPVKVIALRPAMASASRRAVEDLKPPLLDSPRIARRRARRADAAVVVAVDG